MSDSSHPPPFSSPKEIRTSAGRVWWASPKGNSTSQMLCQGVGTCGKPKSAGLFATAKARNSNKPSCYSCDTTNRERDRTEMGGKAKEHHRWVRHGSRRNAHGFKVQNTGGFSGSLCLKKILTKNAWYHLLLKRQLIKKNNNKPSSFHFPVIWISNMGVYAIKFQYPKVSFQKKQNLLMMFIYLY